MYLQGICTEVNNFRTYRKDRILEMIEDVQVGEERLKYYKSINPPPLPTIKSSELLDICFTGFKIDDKERLKELSKQAGFIIRSSVSKNLKYLCCGYKAGPTKVRKAREQGAILFEEFEQRKGK